MSLSTLKKIRIPILLAVAICVVVCIGFPNKLEPIDPKEPLRSLIFFIVCLILLFGYGFLEYKILKKENHPYSRG